MRADFYRTEHITTLVAVNAEGANGLRGNPGLLQNMQQHGSRQGIRLVTFLWVVIQTLPHETAEITDSGCVASGWAC